jgi:hypothetical protein
MTIFLVLNGLSVAFLVYVLLKFWKEGRPSKMNGPPVEEFLPRRGAEVFVVSHPISHTAQGGLSVIPMQARIRARATGPRRKRGSAGVVEIPGHRISA